jgi:hypothetical protein
MVLLVLLVFVTEATGPRTSKGLRSLPTIQSLRLFPAQDLP